MIKTVVKDLYRNQEKFNEQTVQISGWIRTLRDSKTIGFMELNDGTFFKSVQVVFEDTLDNFKEITKLPISSSVLVEGEFVPTPEMKQPFEIKATKIVVEGLSDPAYPLQKKRHSLEYLRTIAHLRPRANTFSAVFRVRSLASYAIHKFFQEKGFVYVHTPIITGSDTEGAGEMFRVTSMDLNQLPKNEDGKVDESADFFGKESNLTVSGQLNAETFALAFRNVYTFGPTFRAENSNTARHAAEFWMIEPEVAFAELPDIMDLGEEMVKYVINYVFEEAPEEMAFFNSFIDKTLIERLKNALESDFGRVTYTEAVDILKNSGKKFDYPVEWGTDLQTEHERYLSEEIYKRPVFVTDYPKEIKAFYMRANDDGKTVAATDLLVPGIGELIGGSQREEREEVLANKIKELGMSEEDYWWYLELRKYGGTKHSGYGIGFERLVMYLTGMKNIRDVIPFPRTPGNADF
ncbi:asparagine--tRNA ligase [Heyndrickxia sporothermodurans]|uniref:Asparagine--tRNA ligase n=1 Tax=Heyndrickxia sporothermodurans TaxID=46224 RepID=A0A150KKS8_9BACI|nr:asparagine--tRNA ligase [Heyndrickxia sporothermodurans]KYC89900.1 Asparaginyl-tRNA synthetase [Heyndrickxia sporothermodurans]MBL5767631.1 asparagine--tRNA ligase [Heyndrickxia sporothermodurans]MBL5771134.1 asparagine--tRNA ligase [Heyndrickxia sporothermodurans]MBL5775368.1 asparagine--tRNA ligase [Heyndrickxia sporothermodurans]MBL5778319.1 asparagine--tRNA ligase [Heyndrickxia sporothermodurans]